MVFLVPHHITIAFNVVLFVEGSVETGLQVINDLINQNVKGKCTAHKNKSNMKIRKNAIWLK